MRERVESLVKLSCTNFLDVQVFSEEIELTKLKGIKYVPENYIWLKKVS